MRSLVCGDCDVVFHVPRRSPGTRRYCDSCRTQRSRAARAEEKRRARSVKASPFLALVRSDPCVYCGGPGEVLDHIVAGRDGGGSDWTNLTSACARCNAQKSATPLLHFLLARPLLAQIADLRTQLEPLTFDFRRAA